MSQYDTYFLMKENDVPGYVQTRYPGHFAPDAVLTTCSAWWRRPPANP